MRVVSGGRSGRLGALCKRAPKASQPLRSSSSSGPAELLETGLLAARQAVFGRIPPGHKAERTARTRKLRAGALTVSRHPAAEIHGGPGIERTVGALQDVDRRPFRHGRLR